ncbi:MAG: NrfD/PsrC family molybdoenzyme membrane anchor subunit [Balneolaceae bacterium]|nr:NrfD/PsrC family molybdoenzyme membrane anchor subunit [Balneolaceae bacterium]
MSTDYKYAPEPALVQGDHSFSSITDLIAKTPLNPTPKLWYLAFGVANILLITLLSAIGYLVWEGTGIWGLNNPAGWGWAIINFVWWVGIGHAGTLISAILFLFRQGWRTAINRFAEAMTIFAVMCAGIFPAIHVGRIWVIYWVFPVPNQMAAWPNFSSPLLWDVFAVSTYFTVSLLFWYVGLVPDLATLRDKAKSKIAKISYGIAALGWTGSFRNWWNYEKAYMILAGLATPLVLSVHTIVSFDFAVSMIPGWHSTIFPPYFVAGAIYSGFAMVLTLMIIARKIYGLEDIMNIDVMEKMNLVMMVTGNLVAFAYLMEAFVAWYSGYIYEQGIFWLYATGPYAWGFWILMFCNVVTPQFLWSKKIRRNIVLTFAISIIVNVGMWFERFMIAVASLSTDFMPSNWDYYSPTFWDIITYIGTFGLFFTFFLLFLRYLPMVAIAEVKGVMPQADPHNYDEETKEFIKENAEPVPAE